MPRAACACELCPFWANSRWGYLRGCVSLSTSIHRKQNDWQSHHERGTVRIYANSATWMEWLRPSKQGLGKSQGPFWRSLSASTNIRIFVPTALVDYVHSVTKFFFLCTDPTYWYAVTFSALWAFCLKWVVGFCTCSRFQVRHSCFGLHMYVVGCI